MHSHSEVERSLKTFLVSEKGFHVSDLLEDPTYPTTTGLKGVRPDIVGVDPKLREPIAIFEVKAEYREGDAKHINQLRSYFEIDQDGRIPVYLVTGPPNELHFYKYMDEEKRVEEETSEDLPSAEQFRAARFDPELPSILREAERTKDNLRRVCWVASAMLISLAVADFVFSFWGVSILTAERMALVGGAVAAAIIPYAQKFKGLGIEYERKSRD